MGDSMSTLKVDTINTTDGSGNITFSRPTVLTAGDIITADILDANVTTAKIADNAITLAKMAGNTDGKIITFDASGDPVAVGPGTDGQVLTSTGAGSPPAFEAAAGGGFTLGTEQATTSGSTITFGSIPSGTKMIIISLNGVSTNGTVNVLVRLGDAGGLETSGYIGASVVAYENGNVLGAGDSTGFPVKYQIYGTFHCGTVICTLVDSSTFDWVMSVSDSPNGDAGVVGGGRKHFLRNLHRLLSILTALLLTLAL